MGTEGRRKRGRNTMRINETLTEKAITAELANRFRQYRISYPMTREELSETAMVSVGTIARFETGSDIGLCNFVKLMKALGIAAHFEELLPDPEERPSRYLDTYKPRERASKAAEKSGEWKWGDEQ